MLRAILVLVVVAVLVGLMRWFGKGASRDNDGWKSDRRIEVATTVAEGHIISAQGKDVRLDTSCCIYFAGIINQSEEGG
jgi:hypothetical protein